jgi:uncharacterized repeat protein (TIGR03803 family)
MLARKTFAVFLVALSSFLGFVTTTKVFAADKEKVLYSFKDNGEDGIYPYASLLSDAAGNLYGTTASGAGAGCPSNYGCGAVFELMPDGRGGWSETLLHSFHQSTGFSPLSGLISDTAGNLYGIASYGGSNNSGMVFELIRGDNGAWTEKRLWNFCSRPQCEDGRGPVGGLVFDGAGRLYGTTVNGGDSSDSCGEYYGCGVVFQLTINAQGKWDEKVLHSFCRFSACDDGGFPSASLVFDAGGNLYGTATGVFELTPAKGKWSFKVLSRNAEWRNGLVFDTEGNLYSVTVGDRFGSVFRLTRGANGNWKTAVLHRFNGRDGYATLPQGTLILDAAGNLYGTTMQGGNSSDTDCSPNGCGVVFELIRSNNYEWRENVLHNFHDDGRDGIWPAAGPIFDAAGNLYGTTRRGGTGGVGTVFEITP